MLCCYGCGGTFTIKNASTFSQKLQACLNLNNALISKQTTSYIKLLFNSKKWTEFYQIYIVEMGTYYDISLNLSPK